MPSSRCLRISENDSLGKRASASTAAAVIFATSAAARARAVRSLWRTLTTRAIPGMRCGSTEIPFWLGGNLGGVMRRLPGTDNRSNTGLTQVRGPAQIYEHMQILEYIV